MSDLQIKVTIGNVDISLQGEGELVYKIFKELCNEGLGVLGSIPTTDCQKDINNDQNDSDDDTENNPKVKKNRKKACTKPPQFIKTLNLNGSNSENDLKNFIEGKKPASNVQRTTLFVYFLQNKLGLSDITIDHIFTCYKNIGVRVPNNLPQNITDACSSRFGFLDRNNGKLTMSVVGTNFVEYDLPKKD